MANFERDLPDTSTLALDPYEVHILHRAVRQYIALQQVERDELDCENPNNPDLHGIDEMTERAKVLRDRITRIMFDM
jgi:hypothetical protein